MTKKSQSINQIARIFEFFWIWVFRSPDHNVNIFLQIALSCSLMITLIARIFYFFMYWLNMSLQIPIWGSLIITLIAIISDFFMYRLNMNLKISLSRSLMVTLIARIFVLTLLASSVQGQAEAREHLPGQGCPVLFVTLSSLILAEKWGGSRVQWGGWSFFRPRCPHQSGATSQHSLSEYLHSESFLTTEKPALSCPDNLSLTQEVTGHTYSCLVSLLPPLHQVAKYWELWHQISKII